MLNYVDVFFDYTVFINFIAASVHIGGEHVYAARIQFVLKLLQLLFSYC